MYLWSEQLAYIHERRERVDLSARINVFFFLLVFIILCGLNQVMVLKQPLMIRLSHAGF